MARFGRTFPIKPHITKVPGFTRPTVTFMEPGGDATFNVVNNQFWLSTGGTPQVATDFVHGGHIKSIKFPTGAGTQTITAPNGTANDAGARISFFIYFNALPSVSTEKILDVFNASFVSIVRLTITTGGVLQLTDNSNVQIGSNGSTLSTGQWYRISLAYTVTSTTVNRFEQFVNGVSSISVTNATISGTSSTRFSVGKINDSAVDIRVSDFYADNSYSLTDTGNIWVTAKRPNANGTTNGFTTQIGSGGSGYGTGHSPQVNERPLSTTNGWSIAAGGVSQTEEYNIESASAGDIDISAATIVDYVGWVSKVSSSPAGTGNIIVNGASSAIGYNDTTSLVTKVAGSSTYPAGTGTDIGISTGAQSITFSLYECGVIVAYIPGNSVYTLTAVAGSYILTGITTGLAHARTLTATAGSYVLTGFAATLKKVRNLTAVAGSYVLTGNAVTFNRVRNMTATAGSYALTGFAAALAKAHTIVATAGTYVLTGFATTLNKYWKLTATAGSYTLTGFATTLHHTRTLTAVAGSYILTGLNTTLVKAKNITAVAGTYVLTGFAVTFNRVLHLVATAGSYILTGFTTILFIKGTVTFLDPGGDADGGTYLSGNTGFYANNSNNYVTAVTDHVNGGHIYSYKLPPNLQVILSTNSTIVSDTGSRLSFYLYINALPTSTSNIVKFQDNSSDTAFSIALTSGGVLRLQKSGGTTQIGSNGSTLSTGVWYRISVAYVITSTSVNTITLFKNGASDITVVNASLVNNSTSVITFCNDVTSTGSADATLDTRISDIYVDKSVSMLDTGNIMVTAKRPISNGTTNQLTTQVGSGGSGYGTGHSPQINERPANDSNGWSLSSAISKTEEYNIEGKSVGDIDISSKTIIEYMGWIRYSDQNLSDNGDIILNGNNTAKSLTSGSPRVFSTIAGSSIYPSGTGKDIGVLTGATNQICNLYEAGVIVAYLAVTNIIYSLATTAGIYVLNGFSTTMNKTLHLVATAGNYILTGFAASLAKGKIIVLNSGTYILTGFATSLHRLNNITATSGTYALTGFSVTFQKAKGMVASAGKYVLTGFVATIIAPIHSIWTEKVVTSKTWTKIVRPASSSLWSKVTRPSSSTGWTKKNRGQ